MDLPKLIPNWINGAEVAAVSGTSFDKLSPATGNILFSVARSNKNDVINAIDSANKAQVEWAETPAVQRGLVLHKLVIAIQKHQEKIAEIVAAETGKSYNDALGETGAAIQCGIFYASEGQRLYGKTTTSGTPNKYAMTVRHPVGIAGLIIAANTPIANVAWKIFPALICGNTVVLKPAEDTPATAWIIGKLSSECGFPPGILNIVQGFGEEVGKPLVENEDIGVISFTGSTMVGRYIQKTAGEQLKKVSLELGGKNPFIVCDDANIDNAVKWAILSAFSNAGQRCASGSRIIVFEKVYNSFKEKLLIETEKLKVGPDNSDDFGPVINERQLNGMLEAIESAKNSGAKVISGGKRILTKGRENGYYLQPTIIENANANDKISTEEQFGPITCLYKARDFTEAVEMANNSPYGLTACIHTNSIHRATVFSKKMLSGAVVINAGTFGSEPHMPFGGYKQSGNGWREPGTEALDIYTELKDVYINVDPKMT
jgi:alpha-ketoglutaric semialdehyde dehydrogenase